MFEIKVENPSLPISKAFIGKLNMIASQNPRYSTMEDMEVHCLTSLANPEDGLCTLVAIPVEDTTGSYDWIVKSYPHYTREKTKADIDIAEALNTGRAAIEFGCKLLEKKLQL